MSIDRRAECFRAAHYTFRDVLLGLRPHEDFDLEADFLIPRLWVAPRLYTYHSFLVESFGYLPFH